MNVYKRNNKKFTLILWAILLLVIGEMIYILGGDQIHKILYGDGAQIIKNRTYEDQVMYPLISPKATYLEHIKIVSPTFSIVLLLGFLIWAIKPVRFINLALILILSLLVLVFFITFYICPSQFLILLLPLISSYYFVSFSSREEDLLDKFNIFFLYLCIQIISITELLSLGHSITFQSFLIAEMLILLISLCFRRKTSSDLSHDCERLKIYHQQLCQYAKVNKLLSIFLCALIASILWRIILIIYIPPNNADSMSYHLSRVAYWMQNRSLDYYFSYNMRQIIFPFNASILFLWTMAASKLDYLCGFIQFVCYLLSGILLYKSLRRFLKCDSTSAFMIILIWYSLPENVLISTSTQNDFFLAYFIMFSLYHFLLGLEEGNNRNIIFSALALGMAIGTKITAFFYLGPFVLLLIFLYFKKQMNAKQLIVWGVSAFFSFVSLSSYGFIQNYIKFRSFFPKEQLEMVYGGIPSWQDWISVLAQNIFNLVSSQNGLQFYLSIATDFYNDLIAKIGQIIFGIFHIEVNRPMTFSRTPFYFYDWLQKFSLYEYFAFFGIIGAVIIFLVFYVFLTVLLNRFTQAKQFNRFYVIFAFLTFGYLLFLSYFKDWDPWLSRYFIVMVLTGTPLLALLFNHQSKFIKKFNSFVCIYSIVLLIPSTFMSDLKPVIPYKLDRYGLQYSPLNRPESLFLPYWYQGTVEQKSRVNGIGWSYLSHNKDKLGWRCLLRPWTEAWVRKYESWVPLKSKVGVVLNFWQWDYLLFGERLERTIIAVNLDNINKERFDFIVVSVDELQKHQELENLIRKDFVKFKKLGRDSMGGVMDLYIPRRNQQPIGQ